MRDSQFHAGRIKRGDGQITIRMECGPVGRKEYVVRLVRYADVA